MGNARLALDDVTKRCGAVVAVRNASASFEAARIHLVCGENGAGKTTLLKIACGLSVPDSGRTLVDGVPLSPFTPSEAIARGIAIVMQHFALAQALTVLENIALVAAGPFDLRALRKTVSARQEALGFTLPLDARVADLSVGDKQRTEIVRALLRDARVLALDEPTAILARSEVVALYALLRKLADGGKAVIVVSHKMDEVKDFADRVTVMRKGEIVWTRDVPRADGEDAVAAFTRNTVREIMGDASGSPVHSIRQKKHNPRSQTDGDDRSARRSVLSVKAITALASGSFEVRAGEILGVAGVEGNGQAALVEALSADGGAQVLVDGAPRKRADISIVHEDRQTMGLVLEATAAENLMLGDLAECTRHGLVDEALLQKIAHARAESVAYTRGLDALAGELSGGNQQKLVVGRALGRGSARVLVFVHPTRGVDLAAAREIHARIVDAAREQRAVIVVSADSDELRMIADRILVVAKHAIVAEFPPNVSDEALGTAMLSGATA